ncbi:hypothetical protein BN1183_BA_01160 [Pantoea ananatis]|jgi:hypothetical protein|nr:hypothetical protein BN1183_BA_01160 [Pantoea ananatis]
MPDATAQHHFLSSTIILFSITALFPQPCQQSHALSTCFSLLPELFNVLINDRKRTVFPARNLNLVW